MRYFLLLILSFYTALSYAQEPKLMLPIGHTYMIKSAEFINGSKRIITIRQRREVQYRFEVGAKKSNLTDAADRIIQKTVEWLIQKNKHK